MVCRCCGGTIAQVGGKSGGYYGCLAASKGACENKTLVRRTLAEKVILEAIRQRISDPEQIAYVLQRVEAEIAKLLSDLPDTLKLKEAELAAEQRRMANFVDFIGEGRGSQALAKALIESERRVESLTAEVDGLRRSREKVFRTPPVEWISDRLSSLQEVLERRTPKSAQTLRTILGPIRMELVTPDIGRPFYRAVTTLDALALTESPPAGAEGGSSSLQRWRRRELNPRFVPAVPKIRPPSCRLPVNDGQSPNRRARAGRLDYGAAHASFRCSPLLFSGIERSADSGLPADVGVHPHPVDLFTTVIGPAAAATPPWARWHQRGRVRPGLSRAPLPCAGARDQS
jgi:hypothetical protein